MFSIRYNRTTNHIDGLSAQSEGSNLNYALSACGTVTRGRLAAGAKFDNVADALAAARKGSRKLCKRCEAAALSLIDAEAPKVDLPEGVYLRNGFLYGNQDGIRQLNREGRVSMDTYGNLTLREARI